MAICSQCQQPNPDSAEVCNQCGARLAQPSIPEPEPIPLDGPGGPQTAAQTTAMENRPAAADDNLTVNSEPLMQRILEFLPQERWPLGLLTAGLFLILLAKIAPALGGTIVFVLLAIVSIFSSSRGSSFNVNINDPASSYWMGGILMVMGLGWLILAWLNFNLTRVQPVDPEPEEESSS